MPQQADAPLTHTMHHVLSVLAEFPAGQTKLYMWKKECMDAGIQARHFGQALRKLVGYGFIDENISTVDRSINDAGRNALAAQPKRPPPNTHSKAGKPRYEHKRNRMGLGRIDGNRRRDAVRAMTRVLYLMGFRPDELQAMTSDVGSLRRLDEIEAAKGLPPAELPDLDDL